MSPAPDSASEKAKKLSLGNTIAWIAASCGLRTEDVAIAVSAFMGNVAGPGAGLKDHTGRRIEPGINIIHLDGGRPHERALLDLVIQPLRTVQKNLRDRARHLPAKLVTGRTFGFDSTLGSLPDLLSQGSELWQTELQTRPQIEKAIAVGPQCSDHDVETGHDPMPDTSNEYQQQRRETFHLHPTFLLEGLEHKLKAALDETFERHAFVFDANGRFFDCAGKGGKLRQDESAFVALLLAGHDISYVRQSPMQGNGSLERSRVRLWSRIKQEGLENIVADRASSMSEIVEQCLCWQADRSERQGYEAEAVRWAWQIYCATIREIMSARAGGRGPVYELNSDQLTSCADLQYEYLDLLQDIGSSAQVSISGFHDLPARLTWALLQLNHGASAKTCIESIYRLALYAVRKHVKLIVNAQRLTLESGRRKLIESVVAALERKGECRLRDLLRSLTVQRKEYVVPALDHLISEGRVVRSKENRFRLASVVGIN